MDTSAGVNRYALPRGVFLGYQHYGDAILVDEQPGVVELRESLWSRAILAAVAAGMVYVLVMIFYVEGWSSFSDRLPAYPAFGVVSLSGLTFVLSFERAFRRRIVRVRFDTRELIFQLGWFVRRESRFSFSEIVDVRLDEVPVFRPSNRPTRIPVFVVEWLSGEKASIAISKNREKLEYLKISLENACLRT